MVVGGWGGGGSGSQTVWGTTASSSEDSLRGRGDEEAARVARVQDTGKRADAPIKEEMCTKESSFLNSRLLFSGDGVTG